MREFQEKEKIRRRLYSKTSIVILFIIMIFVARGVIGLYSKEKTSRFEVERLTKQKVEIENRLKSVSKQNEMLATTQGIEYEIRNKFDVVKEGEGVIVIVDKELPPPPEEKKSFLKKFWGSVKGVFKSDDEEKVEKADTKTEGKGE